MNFFEKAQGYRTHKPEQSSQVSPDRLSLVPTLIRRSAVMSLERERLRADSQGELPSELLSAFEVAQSLLSTLQIDSLTELNLANGILTRVYGRSEMGRSALEYLGQKHLSQRKLLFLMIAQCFNRADELVEQAFENTPQTELGAEHAMNLLKSLSIAEVTSAEGARTQLNFLDIFPILARLTESWGIKADEWSTYLSGIITSQLANLELVKHFQAGQLYPLATAIACRRETVGRYAEFLGNIFFDEGEDHDQLVQAFTTRMMYVQFIDDMTDILQDEKSQVNPFITWLSEEGVLAAFKNFSQQRGLRKLWSQREKFLLPVTTLESFINKLPEHSKRYLLSQRTQLARMYMEPLGPMR